jgi:hypothetical protein
VLKVDGRDVATQTLAHTVPFVFAIDETFDVGADTRTPVNDKDYRIPFRFTEKIDKLTYQLGPVQLADQDRGIIRRAHATAHD